MIESLVFVCGVVVGLIVAAINVKRRFKIDSKKAAKIVATGGGGGGPIEPL